MNSIDKFNLFKLVVAIHAFGHILAETAMLNMNLTIADYCSDWQHPWPFLQHENTYLELCSKSARKEIFLGSSIEIGVGMVEFCVIEYKNARMTKWAHEINASNCDFFAIIYFNSKLKNFEYKIKKNSKQNNEFCEFIRYTNPHYSVCCLIQSNRYDTLA